MFIILVVFFVVAVSALVFVSFTGFRSPPKVRESVPDPGLEGLPQIGLDDLRRFAEKLLTHYDIAIESESENGDSEVTLAGQSDHPVIGGRYIVVCHEARGGETVPLTRLLEFRDEVKASGATKGVFVTNGFFPSDASFLLEDAPVSLLNRKDIHALRAGNLR